MTFLDTLNPAQRRAVEFFEPRPLVVVAGPGTGKTRVLSHKIAYLIKEKGVAPKEILAITFTNFAANEMRDRIESLVQESPLCTTFHAWAYTLIREFLGEEAPFIIDELDALSLFKEAIKLSGLKSAGSARQLFKEIGLMRQSHPPKRPEDWGKKSLFLFYQALLSRHRVVDFDELMLLALSLLEDESLLKTIRKRWPYVLVDEFQDVNGVQVALVEQLSPKYLTLIGDPDQSIYAFRGSDPRALERFVSTHPDAEVITLETAYRCHGEVLGCAASLLSDKSASKKKLKAEKGHGPKVEIRGFTGPREEARWIARTIESLTGALSFEAINFSGDVPTEEGAFSLGDVAILTRTRSSVSAIKEALSRAGIPFLETYGHSLAQDRYLRSFIRLISISRGENPEFHKRRLEEEAHMGPNEIDKCLKAISKGELKEVLRKIGGDPEDALYRAFLKQVTTTNLTGAVPLELGSDVDLLGVRLDAVHLMTIHGAKGLEFPVVFIPRCEAGMIPIEGGDEEEERRLFYVAITRAVTRLYITYSSASGGKSPFLERFPEGLYLEEFIRSKKKAPRRPKGPRQGSLF